MVDSPGAGPSPSTASSYVELAAVLGVTRQSINTWKKRKDSPKVNFMQRPLPNEAIEQQRQ